MRFPVKGFTTNPTLFLRALGVENLRPSDYVSAGATMGDQQGVLEEGTAGSDRDECAESRRSRNRAPSLVQHKSSI